MEPVITKIDDQSYTLQEGNNTTLINVRQVIGHIVELQVQIALYQQQLSVAENIGIDVAAIQSPQLQQPTEEEKARQSSALQEEQAAE